MILGPRSSSRTMIGSSPRARILTTRTTKRRKTQEPGTGTSCLLRKELPRGAPTHELSHESRERRIPAIRCPVFEAHLAVVVTVSGAGAWRAGSKDVDEPAT
jgi:hypothetical protein